ncbi:hypothetical protein ABIF83_000487 [Bradyrhizobium ottawaense]
MYLGADALGKLDNVVGHDVPILRRLEIGLLARTMLGRTRDEGRFQASRTGSSEVAIVRRAPS